MAKKSSLRIGVIGAGFMGRLHIHGIREIIRRRLLPISLDAIGGLDHARGREVAEECGCPYYESGDRLLSESGVDVVVIVTPTGTHLPLVKKAVAAGKAVFLEKPLGRNLIEAEKTADALVSSHTPHQVGLVLRFSPTYNVLKKLISDPSNGEFIFCRFRDDQFFPEKSIYDSAWRADVKMAGGGTLIEHSIHDVDVITWFFGEPVVTDAMILPSHAKGIEKLAALNLEFPLGGRAQLSSIWHHNLTRENERHIEIFFENRFYSTLGEFTSPIQIQGPKGSVRVIEKDEIERRFRAMIGWRDRKNADFPSTIGYEMYVFLKNVLEGRKESAMHVNTGLAAHRVIEAAYRMGKPGAKK